MREVHRKGRKVGKEEGKKRGGKTQRFWDLSKIALRTDQGFWKLKHRSSTPNDNGSPGSCLP